MNPALIPFLICPIIALFAGVALIVMAVMGEGPRNTFLIVGGLLIALGIMLPMMFWIVSKPRK